MNQNSTKICITGTRCRKKHAAKTQSVLVLLLNSLRNLSKFLIKPITKKKKKKDKANTNVPFSTLKPLHHMAVPGHVLYNVFTLRVPFSYR